LDERERKSWVVWWEGMRFPDVIIALLSDSTRGEDTGVKKELYARLFHTAGYYLYDPFSQEFIGYELRGAQYAEVECDGAGRIYSPVTGLYLAVREGWLRWLGADGEILPTPWELALRERQRADRAEELLETYRRRFGSLE
jgi:Uma2 family endonuclease